MKKAIETVSEKNDRQSLWTRNVRKEFKNLPNEEVKAICEERALPFAILASQIYSDFNFGSVIRSANNFACHNVYYYGSKKFDRRSCCGTYHYLSVEYLSDLEGIKKLKEKYWFVGLENNVDKPIHDIRKYNWKPNSLIVLGEEGAGICAEVCDLIDEFVEIPSMGSVPSLNVASAATTAMYDYVSKYKG